MKARARSNRLALSFEVVCLMCCVLRKTKGGCPSRMKSIQSASLRPLEDCRDMV